ncbi:MAG: tRNA (cytidine(34)-2'-O)-methyltransferase [Pseudomonadota bacterium]|nr:tRNA (cytidine(34)-2'-O)-methyltransferase [Pseudomonadota bacterium]
MRLALYQPDIPQNLGTMLRLAACLNVGVDIIEPCGFPLDDKRIKRAGMDYLAAINFSRYKSWNDFLSLKSGRVILMTTKSSTSLLRFEFRTSDILLLGRESAGVPETVHAECDRRLLIPMAKGKRSLNVAVAAAIALGEGLRQTNGFPPLVEFEGEI